VRDRRGGAPAQGRAGDGHRSGGRPKKQLIERAYRLGEALGLAVWCQDEAGPFQTTPCPGASWQPIRTPARQPHAYARNGTAELLALFRPANGEVRVKGVTSGANAVLHAGLRTELAAALAALPPAAPDDPAATRLAWAAWRTGLGRRCTLPDALPPLRLLLVLDNLAGHKTPELALWRCAHGIMPLYTPLGGSWLNMAESIQRILKRRALAGTAPATPHDIIAALEATARGWNAAPPPCVWGGKRAARRDRARQRRHAPGGSGAQTHRPVRRRSPRAAQWLHTCQPTH
jgi:hypothetical protein